MRFQGWLLLVPLTLLGCDPAIMPLRPDGGGDAQDGASAAGSVNYHAHIRPILVESCTTCHAPGGIAPFALETYEQAVEVGERMAEVTRDRVMPPFLADNSGECNTWANHRGLTDEEIDLIGEWVAQGTSEGDASIPAPPPVELLGLPSVDLTIEMPSSYLIDEAVEDDYHCFVVESGNPADTIVTGYNVIPGNTARVHHVIVYNPDDDAAEATVRSMDSGNGYSCYGGPGVDASPIALWAPGTGATTYPDGTGLPLAAGRALVIQIHYNNAAPESDNDDQTRVEFSTSATAAPASLTLISDNDLNLPPRMESVIETNSMRFRGLPGDARIWGVLPHMHSLGNRFDIQINRGTGADQCLIDIPRWDFNWQLGYWLDSPITVNGSDGATIRCDYNTMERDELTTFGEGSNDEMCLAFIYASR